MKQQKTAEETFGIYRETISKGHFILDTAENEQKNILFIKEKAKHVTTRERHYISGYDCAVRHQLFHSSLFIF